MPSVRILRVLIAGLLALAGCADSSTPAVSWWAESDLENIFPQSPPAERTVCFDRRTATIRLAGAVNETVAFQLAARTQGGVAEDFCLEVGPLVSDSGRQLPATPEIYRVLYAAVDDLPAWYLLWFCLRPPPQEFPDGLVPTDAPRLASPLRLWSERNEVLWVDVPIPKGTAPGDYVGPVRLWAGGVQVGQGSVHLHVYEFALPDRPALPAAVGIDLPTLCRAHLQLQGKPYAPRRLAAETPLREEALALVRACCQLLRDHRCDPVLTGLHPVLKTDPAGRAIVNWDDYDLLAGPVLEGSAFADRLGVRLWALPVDETFPSPAAYGGVDSAAYAVVLREYLQRCGEHFAEKGWLDRHFLHVPFYDGPTAEHFEHLRWLGRLAREADVRLRVWSWLPPQPLAPLGWTGAAWEELGGEVGGWCVTGQFWDRQTIADQRAASKTCWLRPDHPPFSASLDLASHGTDPCALAWQAWRLGADGLWLQPGNQWSSDPLRRGPEDPDEGWLIVPGRSAGLACPLPTVRLKRLRRGLQDYQYLWLLARRARGRLADLLAEAMVCYAGTDSYGDVYADGRPGGWPAGASSWREARRLLAAELERALSGGLPEAHQRLAGALGWQKLLADRRRVAVELEGIRLRKDAHAPDQLRADLHLRVENHTGRDLRWSAALGRLPAGWAATAEKDPAGQLAPGQLARCLLSAQASALGTDLSGAAYVEVQLRPGQDPPITCRGRLSVVTAARARKPITIDGELSDWPVTAGNTASDFRQVGGVWATQQSSEQPAADQQTQAFFAHDGNNLYVAVRCFDSQPDQITTRPDNAVRYDGLTPVGEDLVEVLLDPTNSDSGGSGHLYHLLIKPSGVLISELGIGTPTPIGPHAAWLCRGELACTRFSDGWIAELRVPVGAFGPAVSLRRIWGVNVGRYQQRLGEYSSWSAARRHLYAARSLGNVIWLAEP